MVRAQAIAAHPKSRVRIDLEFRDLQFPDPFPDAWELFFGIVRNLKKVQFFEDVVDAPKLEKEFTGLFVILGEARFHGASMTGRTLSDLGSPDPVRAAFLDEFLLDARLDAGIGREEDMEGSRFRQVLIPF
jgi:hypothetical protein